MFVVVRMFVAPGPVMPLLLAILLVVITIFSALFGQIISVGAVLAIVPVVVIPVVTIVNPKLDAGFLRRGTCKHDGRRYKSRGKYK